MNTRRATSYNAVIMAQIASSTKATPIRLEEAFMQLHLDCEAALRVRHRVLPEPVDPSASSFADIDASLVMDRFIPAFFVMKLSALLDSAINTLWNEFFPDEPAERKRIHEKLGKLSSRRLLDSKAIAELREIRNRLAHAVEAEVGWDEYYQFRYVVVCVLTRLSNPSLRNPETRLPDLV